MFKDSILIEKLHIRFCKQVLGLHSKSSNQACRAELGRFHFSCNIYYNVIKYWNRLCSMSDEFLAKEAYYLNVKFLLKEKLLGFPR